MRIAVRMIAGSLFCFLLFSSAEAQVALLDRVYDFIQSRDYKRAQEAITLAEKNVTTSNDARTYYLKAFVNKELFLSASTPTDRQAYRAVLLTSLERCRQLDHDGTFKQATRELEDFVLAGIFNEASDLYNSQQFKACIDPFMQYCRITSKEDDHWLDAHYFIGTSYYELQQWDSAAHYLEFVKAKNYDEPMVYVDLTYLYHSQQNQTLALQTIEEGVSRYPGFYDLEVAQLNVLVSAHRYDTLERVLTSFLGKNPDHVEALMMAGTVYERKRPKGEMSSYFLKAESVYKHVIELEPKHVDANYNLGVLYYNEAVDIVNKNDIDTDMDELTKILEKSTELFEKALPYLLTIYETEKGNMRLLQALQAIYYNLNMKPELNDINNQIQVIKKL
jgi:tetratricopeptide (TPR) repeat protein